MYVKKLEGGGEIRLRNLGSGWTLSIVTEAAKGIAVGLTVREGIEVGQLLMYEDNIAFEERDTGVIDVSNIDGEQHEKENTDD